MPAACVRRGVPARPTAVRLAALPVARNRLERTLTARSGGSWEYAAGNGVLDDMTQTTAGFLELAATLYGVGAAAAVLLQARQMLRRRRSCDVSARFFAVYVGGYAIWLLYGVSIASVPLIVADVVGLLCGGATLVVALRLRGSLVRPSTWASCDLASEPAI